MTTFITPWGRYRYKTATQGYIASGDGFSRRYDEIVSDKPNKTKCVDDSLLWANDITSSFFQTVDWLDTCGRNGIILNPEKFTFGADTVTFAGFEITPYHVRPYQHSTWTPSAIFPDHKTSLTCGPGLDSSIKFHTLSLLQNTCSLSARLSNPAQHLLGLTN